MMLVNETRTSESVLIALNSPLSTVRFSLFPDYLRVHCNPAWMVPMHSVKSVS